MTAEILQQCDGRRAFKADKHKHKDCEKAYRTGNTDVQRAIKEASKGM